MRRESPRHRGARRFFEPEKLRDARGSEFQNGLFHHLTNMLATRSIHPAAGTTVIRAAIKISRPRFDKRAVDPVGIGPARNDSLQTGAKQFDERDRLDGSGLH
jgi:hypothetical protein